MNLAPAGLRARTELANSNVSAITPCAELGNFAPAGLRARKLLLCLLLILFAAGTCFGQQAPRTAGKFRIAGTVVNASTGEIVRGALVMIGESQSMDTLQSVTSGEDGGFHFDGLKAGKYWLRAQARGFGQQGFEEHQGFFTGVVTGGAVDSEHLMFQLRPEAGLVGQIVDEGNEPLRNAEVMLYKREQREGKEATTFAGNAATDDDGRYRFSHLLPGTYFIAARATPWYAQNQHVIQSLETSAEVQLRDEGGAREDEGATDLSNRVQPAPAEAETSGGDPLDVTYPITYFPGATEASQATPIVLQAGDRATADLRMVAVPAVHLRIHRSIGDAATAVGATVMEKIFDGPEQPARAQTMQTLKGDFEISGIAPGDYEVRVQTYGATTQTWAQRVSLGGNTDLTVDRPATLALVKGVVKVGDAVAKRGFVQLENLASGERWSAPILEKGEFQFSSDAIGSGTYEVEAAVTDNASVTGIAASGAKVNGHSIEIAGSGVVQLSIEMREGLGSVEGTVMREEKPAAGAMVVLIPRDLHNNQTLVRRDQSDLDGTFTLRSVVPGTYTLMAIQHGWDIDWMDPKVMGEYLKKGEVVEVRPNGKYDVKVKVQ